MSGSKGSSNSQSQQQSQSYLDPQIVDTLLGNYGQAKSVAANTTYQPLTGGQVNSVYSPYVQDAVNTTAATIQNQTQQQESQNDLAASASGAYNGDRAGVQDAVTGNLGAQTLASATANLENTGYESAVGTAATQSAAENQYPIALQELINQSLGLVGNPILSSSTGSSSGSSSTGSFGFSPGTGNSLSIGG